MMNPNPFVALNHLTVPLAITLSLSVAQPREMRGSRTTGPSEYLVGARQTECERREARQGKPKYDCNRYSRRKRWLCQRCRRDIYEPYPTPCKTGFNQFRIAESIRWRMVRSAY